MELLYHTLCSSWGFPSINEKCLKGTKMLVVDKEILAQYRNTQFHII